MMSAPFSGQQGAGTESAFPLVKGLRQRNGRLRGWGEIDLLQQAQCFNIQIANRFGLDAIGDHCEQEMPCEMGRCHSSECCSPSVSQGFDIEIAQARDLGIDGARVRT
jgi:hypothetical protein